MRRGLTHGTGDASHQKLQEIKARNEAFVLGQNWKVDKEEVRTYLRKYTDYGQEQFQKAHVNLREDLERRMMDKVRQAGFNLSGHLMEIMEEIMDWHKILYQKGWVAPHWPEEYGGAGFDAAQKRNGQKSQDVRLLQKMIHHSND